jgi:hypothetical protein
VDRVCSALEGTDRTAQAQAVLSAVALFDKARGGESAAWDVEVLAEPVDDEVLARLRRSLVSFVERHLVPPPLASAIWALGRMGGKDLRPLFVRCLQEHATWGADTGVLYQSMVALDVIGERVFSDGRGTITDVERNLRLAAQYLEKAGVRTKGPE